MNFNTGPGRDIFQAMKINPDLSTRLPENAPGPWFVTDDCIICGLCDELAPAVFRSLDDFSFNIVHHQPDSSEEEALAREAADCCPAQAIQKIS